ncbi:hypothetical protein GCM10010840_29940 [Deinococcus aerolatus]|uniref:Uncharacterized protein n=1 Tax=Deinococcus aerolatus TaxID=522487 RepID=A0ABQ2GDU1_9DEIO|nr:hypothetical protein [Deinococcus aerolatus]GGL89927.1 hypothetical protein GCM10010840_29940 [Deinococcus aerolatus]
MDAVLHSKGPNTLIVPDGQVFHGDPFDDELCSTLILQTGLIEQVTRFDGAMPRTTERSSPGVFIQQRLPPKLRQW